jgi:hypothetical protein
MPTGWRGRGAARAASSLSVAEEAYGLCWRGHEGPQLMRVLGRRMSTHASSQGQCREGGTVIRKLASGKYRLYSRKKDPKTGKRRNLGTFNTRAAAEKHERAVQFFKRGG